MSEARPDDSSVVPARARELTEELGALLNGPPFRGYVPVDPALARLYRRELVRARRTVRRLQNHLNAEAGA